MVDYARRSWQGSLGVLSEIMGGLGILLFWLWPFGLILGGVGFVAGLVGMTMLYPVSGRPLRQAMFGTLFSAAAIILSIWLPWMLGMLAD